MILFLLLALLSTSVFAEDSALNLWPYSRQSAPDPPTYKPYNLPRFDSGDSRHFNDHIQPLVRAPQVNGEKVYLSVLGCFPGKSFWKIDIEAQGSLRTKSGISSSADGTLIGGSYVGIVARMPLYSATEMSRDREREYRRRTATAKVVADFVAAIASRNHALRELGLYSSLEARAHQRVQQGISGAEEQIKYLEKVASTQETLVTKEAKIMETRLIMVGMCADDKSDALNNYLSSLAQVATNNNL